MSGTDAERIARLEQMVFLMLSIMNGTIFAGADGNCDTFGAQLEELWHLQRASEGTDEKAWRDGIEPIEPDDAIPKRLEEAKSG